MKDIVLLGSTGSIGKNTLEVVRHLRDRFRVVGLSAGSQWEMLADQALEFRPRTVGIADERAGEPLRERLSGSGIEVWSGRDSIRRMAAEVDAHIVVSAVVGGCGLSAAVEVVRRGVTLALANKESLVMGGHVVMDLARQHEAAILPVDSEHSAIFQAMHAGHPEHVKRVIITASGGPFFRRKLEELASIKPEDALAHPTWNMGRKITIDSATLMNKALEVIEARWLFDLRPDQISVVIHPQSIVHSFVEFLDGSVVAQLGMPDMKLPIQYALTYPERCEGPSDLLDIARVGVLEFYDPDLDRFPALRMGFEAVRVGGTYGATMSAANEVAVDAFLNGRIGFMDILQVIQCVLDRHEFKSEPTLEELFDADAWARTEAEKWIS